jgi:FkbM family methyltransferase
MPDGVSNPLREFLRRTFLAKVYRNVRQVRALHLEPQMTPLGFRFGGNAAMESGTFEPEETALVRRLLQRSDVVVNVGANIGYYCCLAIRDGKDVIAFEPVELNVRQLLKNLRANGWDGRAEVYPMAMSSAVGVVDLYGSGTAASMVQGWAGIPQSDVRLVPAATLDIVLGSRVQGRRCLVIIDVEGAEQAVLEGAGALLSANPKPLWMVEIAVAEHQPDGRHVNPSLLKTFQLFWDSGYAAVTADRQLREVSPIEVQQAARTGVSPFSAHNFLFVDASTAGQLLSDLRSDQSRSSTASGAA